MNITSAGTYLTRNGRTVIINEVNLDSEFTFPVKGHVMIPSKTSNRIKREWTIWQRNGCHVAIGEHNWDIVGEANGNSGTD